MTVRRSRQRRLTEPAGEGALTRAGGVCRWRDQSRGGAGTRKVPALISCPGDPAGAEELERPRAAWEVGSRGRAAALSARCCRKVRTTPTRCGTPEGGNQGDIWTALRRTETLGLRRESMRRTLEVAAAILGPKVQRTE
ncbi:hypothetical protein NDU88_004717 [Pleurodeles waltl]|uniref:Uncharacterized protein n=1 Tax=Pleurodeles waltl TaxID=8319 RepID=A0AAV7NPD8_PLEWA|nr:hypothetical protein NDU88_004717 [Pleurodeles waltl]